MHNKHSSFPLYNLLLLSCEVFHSGLSIVTPYVYIHTVVKVQLELYTSYITIMLLYNNLKGYSNL